MKKVWISRPRRRANALAKALAARHIDSIIRPAIQIRTIRDNILLADFLARRRQFDIAIFISEEAVWRCRQLARGKPLLALAIGSATYAAIKKNTALSAIDISHGDTDTLLQSLQSVADKNIAVIGGEPPAPPLCEALRQGGAYVTEIAAYRRQLPPPDATLINMAKSKQLHAAVAYSGETAANMIKMTAPDNAWLYRLPLFVIHPRIAANCKQMGYQNIILAPADAPAMSLYIDKTLASIY